MFSSYAFLSVVENSVLMTEDDAPYFPLLLSISASFSSAFISSFSNTGLAKKKVQANARNIFDLTGTFSHLYCEKMAVSYSNQHVLTISCLPVLDNDKSRVILYASISGAVVFIVCCSLLACVIYRWRVKQRKGKNQQQLL